MTEVQIFVKDYSNALCVRFPDGTESLLGTDRSGHVIALKVPTESKAPESAKQKTMSEIRKGRS